MKKKSYGSLSLLGKNRRLHKEKMRYLQERNELWNDVKIRDSKLEDIRFEFDQLQGNLIRSVNESLKRIKELLSLD